MKPKILMPVLALSILFIMGVYFLTNPSYEKSIRAKYYYEIGDYTQAYSLAKEAFGLDIYNRMAATIMAQSNTSIKYDNYNKDAQNYMAIIDEISLHENISEADKAKIRLICEIMMSGYIKLAPSVITDSGLVEKTAIYHDKFEKLLEKVNKQ